MSGTEPGILVSAGEESHPVRISVVIHTLNEERRLPYALRSVRMWADEIVVVDMHSDDRTVEIAESFGARIFQHERLGYADPARAFALAKAGGDWILILDADELVPPRLARRLIAIARADDVDVVELGRLNYLLGEPLKWTGWGPDQDRHPRFFRKGWVETTPDIHAYLRLREGARILHLPSDERLALVHFNYVDVSHFVEKLNRYTSIEADSLGTSGRQLSRMRVITRTIREFRDRWWTFGGRRDGWRGFYLAGLMAFYRFTVLAKQAELTRVGTRDDIERRYDAEAERWLDDDGTG